MRKLKFEYRITLGYLFIGAIWILFSDSILKLFAGDIHSLSELQTYKGWFYVIVTAILFFVFLKRHLKKLRRTEEELSRHRNNLQQLVAEKTEKAESLNEELRATNEVLQEKSRIIGEQNEEMKEALQHLKDTQEQLIQSAKMASFGVLTAGVAHEINNPLNFILGGLTGLENRLKEERVKDPKIGLYLDSIKAGVDRAGAIVTALDQFGGGSDPIDKDCEIHSIVENCLAILNIQFKKRVRIIRDYEEGEMVVTGNTGQLHQVFMNLLLNAGQSIGEEGSIEVSIQKEKKQVCIRITDTGCGIREEDLPKITDPFFTTKKPGEGIGIGLSITYSLIQFHRGTLSFESEVNKGTTVTVLLPLKGAIYG